MSSLSSFNDFESQVKTIEVLYQNQLIKQDAIQNIHKKHIECFLKLFQNPDHLDKMLQQKLLEDKKKIEENQKISSEQRWKQLQEHVFFTMECDHRKEKWQKKIDYIENYFESDLLKQNKMQGIIDFYAMLIKEYSDYPFLKNEQAQLTIWSDTKNFFEENKIELKKDQYILPLGLWIICIDSIIKIVKSILLLDSSKEMIKYNKDFFLFMVEQGKELEIAFLQLERPIRIKAFCSIKHKIEKLFSCPFSSNKFIAIKIEELNLYL